MHAFLLYRTAAMAGGKVTAQMVNMVSFLNSTYNSWTCQMPVQHHRNPRTRQCLQSTVHQSQRCNRRVPLNLQRHRPCLLHCHLLFGRHRCRHLKKSHLCSPSRRRISRFRHRRRRCRRRKNISMSRFHRVIRLNRRVLHRIQRATRRMHHVA